MNRCRVTDGGEVVTFSHSFTALRLAVDEVRTRRSLSEELAEDLHLGNRLPIVIS